MTTNTGLLASMRALDARSGAVRMEDTYDTAVDDLWSALTEPARLARWIGEVSGDLRVGGTFHASFTSSWTGPGRVEVCEPPQRLLVRMDPGTDDETVIEAVLTADGERTRLVIEERGLPLDHIHAYGAGWQAHVEDLAAYLAGNKPSDWHARWTELRPSYLDLAAKLV